MAKTAQITCINKIDRPNPFERITHVGGGVGKDKWRITQQAAIDHIQSREWEFWVKPPNGDSVWVEVAVSRFGNDYIKTVPDGEGQNNLLSLPECPKS
jgi:hypothetical protein